MDVSAVTRARTWWVLPAVLAALAACRTAGPRYAGPPPDAAANAPSATGAFASAGGPAFSPEVAPGDWWRLYRDPRLDGLVREAFAADAARAYAEVCGAGEQLAAARRSLALQQQSGALTARLVRAGRSTALDLTRSVAQISQFQADIPALEAAQRNALYRLAVLTGRPPADDPRELEGCSAPPRLLAPLPVGDGAALIRRRPNIRKAERDLAAATYRIGVSTAELASAGTTGAIGDAFTAPANRYGVGPTLS